MICVTLNKCICILICKMEMLIIPIIKGSIKWGDTSVGSVWCPGRVCEHPTSRPRDCHFFPSSGLYLPHMEVLRLGVMSLFINTFLGFSSHSLNYRASFLPFTSCCYLMHFPCSRSFSHTFPPFVLATSCIREGLPCVSPPIQACQFCSFWLLNESLLVL